MCVRDNGTSSFIILLFELPENSDTQISSSPSLSSLYNLISHLEVNMHLSLTNHLYFSFNRHIARLLGLWKFVFMVPLRKGFVGVYQCVCETGCWNTSEL